MIRSRSRRIAISLAERFGVLPHGINLAADLRRRLPSITIDLIFDIGANVGQSAYEFALEFPDARILSFEPDSQSFSKLKSNLNGNQRACAHNIGFSDRTGRLRFDNTSPVTEIHAIANDQDNGHLPLIEVTTIDLFCAEHQVKRIGLLKIDTEGHDLNVIRGSSSMLELGCIDLVLTECSLSQTSKRLVSFSDMQIEMRKRDYVCFGIYHQAFGSGVNNVEISWANCAYVPARAHRNPAVRS